MHIVSASDPPLLHRSGLDVLHPYRMRCEARVSYGEPVKLTAITMRRRDWVLVLR